MTIQSLLVKAAFRAALKLAVAHTQKRLAARDRSPDPDLRAEQAAARGPRPRTSGDQPAENRSSRTG